METQEPKAVRPFISKLIELMLTVLLYIVLFTALTIIESCTKVSRLIRLLSTKQRRLDLSVRNQIASILQNKQVQLETDKYYQGIGPFADEIGRALLSIWSVLVSAIFSALYSFAAIVRKIVTNLLKLFSKFSIWSFIRRLAVDLIILLFLTIVSGYIIYQSVIDNVDCFIVTIPPSGQDDYNDKILRETTRLLLANVNTRSELEYIISALQEIVDWTAYEYQYAVAQNNLGCAKLKLALIDDRSTSFSPKREHLLGNVSFNFVLLPARNSAHSMQSLSDLNFIVQDAVQNFVEADLVEGINSGIWQHCQGVTPVAVEPQHDLLTSNDEDAAVLEVVHMVIWKVFSRKPPDCIRPDQITSRSISLDEVDPLASDIPTFTKVQFHSTNR